MKPKIKSFIRSAHLGATIYPSHQERNKSTFVAGFCQCCLLGEYVVLKPENFTVETWQSTDELNWNKISEIHYDGVIWNDCVEHSDPVEMSACRGTIDFTYDNMVENSFEARTIVVNSQSSIFIWEFVDLTGEV